MNGQVDIWMDKWMDAWMDDGWMMDRQMDMLTTANATGMRGMRHPREKKQTACTKV